MPTKPLLGCGVAAGVLMPALFLAEGSIRPGYSLWHYGASRFGTGGRWWLLMLTFVIGGLPLIAFAAGLSRVLHPGRAVTWYPS